MTLFYNVHQMYYLIEKPKRTFFSILLIITLLNLKSKYLINEYKTKPNIWSSKTSKGY